MGREQLSPVPNKRPQLMPALDSSLSRRDVLKIAALAGAYKAIEHTHPPFLLPKRPDHPMIEGVVIVDFAPQTWYESYPNFEQSLFPDNEDLLKNKMGVNYLPPWRRTLSELKAGLQGFFDRSINPRDVFIADNPEMAIAMGAVDKFEGHGEIVIATMRRTLWHIGQDLAGHETDSYDSMLPEIEPIQLAFNRFTFVKDTHDDTTMSTKLNIDTVIKLLQGRSEPIVNFSWQAGELDVTITSEKTDPTGHVNDPQVIYHGAYTKDRAVTSLRELFKMTDEFKNKMFICAAGNYGDDIREARSELVNSGEWPNNLILTAQWTVDESGREHPKENIYGADIYSITDEKNIPWGDMWDGSTISTAETTTLLAYLNHLGVDIATAKEFIVSKCTRDTGYAIDTIAHDPPDQVIEDAKVFVPGKFISLIRTVSGHYPNSTEKQ